MNITVTPQGVITFASLCTAIILLVERFAKGVRWFDKQDKQSTDIDDLREQHNSDVKSINEELTLLTYGILACLKGLNEKGCNGPVTEAIGRIEKHLNQRAHNQS